MDLHLPADILPVCGPAVRDQLHALFQRHRISPDCQIRLVDLNPHQAAMAQACAKSSA